MKDKINKLEQKVGEKREKRNNAIIKNLTYSNDKIIENIAERLKRKLKIDLQTQDEYRIE